MAVHLTSRACTFIPIIRRKYICAAVSVTSFFTSSRHTAVQNTAPTNSVNLNASAQFTVFYRFPYIIAARLMSRLKIFQTAVTVVAIPPSVYYYSIGVLGLDSCVSVFAISTFALVMLYIATNFFQRVVGLVAISGDQELVRLSHLTFFGGRKDVIVPIGDLVPLSDTTENWSDIFVKVRRYSTTDTLYMTLRMGQVENGEIFQKVFGFVS